MRPLVALFPVSILAAPGPAPPEAGESRCYQRIYSAAHLRRHPGQAVRELTLEMSLRGGQKDYTLHARWVGDDVWYSNFGVFEVSSMDPVRVTRHMASEGTGDSGSGTFIARARRASLTIEVTEPVTLIAPCAPGACDDAATRALDATNPEHRSFLLNEVRCGALPVR